MRSTPRFSFYPRGLNTWGEIYGVNPGVKLLKTGRKKARIWAFHVQFSKISILSSFQLRTNPYGGQMMTAAVSISASSKTNSEHTFSVQNHNIVLGPVVEGTQAGVETRVKSHRQLQARSWVPIAADGHTPWEYRKHWAGLD